ncbi:LytS/YhcK type 5TM receptor domain-containing protein [Bosea lathyri]|uniref:5TMR of 5TMR-LYT n=1 Tax=Bosea lathyri TaxID=1036778 RepID=A0A1H6A0K1_9HYPH|nr:LytS/YhcK type 5TM receptor domain-containing protein [Bosea lathyri]SEG42283.1 5TMR of 5TMR-LYT [Bosea lathyri]
MPLIVDLIKSLSFVLLAALALTIILPRLDHHPLLRPLVVAAVLVAAGFCGMVAPFMLAPGIAIDSRNVVVLLAGPVGGILATILVAVPLALFRYANGGIGMPMGILGIGLSALFGIAIRLHAKRRGRELAFQDVWLLALAAGFVLLPPVLMLPNWEMVRSVLVNALPITLLVNVTGAALAGLMIVAEAERRETAYRLKTLIQRAPGTLYQRIVHIDGSTSYHFASFAIDGVLDVTKEEVERDPETWIGKMLPEDRAPLRSRKGGSCRSGGYLALRGPLSRTRRCDRLAAQRGDHAQACRWDDGLGRHSPGYHRREDA